MSPTYLGEGGVAGCRRCWPEAAAASSVGVGWGESTPTGDGGQVRGPTQPGAPSSADR